MRGLHLYVWWIGAITLAGAWAAFSLLKDPAPPPSRLFAAGDYEPAPPMRQLYPDTWFFGEVPHQPHWSNAPIEPVEFVCEVC